MQMRVIIACTIVMSLVSLNMMAELKPVDNPVGIKVVNNTNDVIQGSLVTIKGSNTIDKVFTPEENLHEKAKFSLAAREFELQPDGGSVTFKAKIPEVMKSAHLFVSTGIHTFQRNEKLPKKDANNTFKKLPYISRSCSGEIVYTITSVNKKITVGIDNSASTFKCDTLAVTKEQAGSAWKDFKEKVDTTWQQAKIKASERWNRFRGKAQKEEF